MLVPRDPHWLCAQWDASPDQIHRLNTLPKEVLPALRVFAGPGVKTLTRRVPVVVSKGGRGSWFVEVDRSRETYAAEIGYEDSAGSWVCLAGSPHVSTPPEAAAHETGSSEAAYEVMTIPPDAPLPPLVGPAAEQPVLTTADVSSSATMPPATSPEPTLATGVPTAVSVPAVSVGSLMEAFGGPAVSERPSSLQRPFGPLPQEEGLSSAALAPEARPPARDFWLNLNVELVVYGQTAPDAKLAVAGRPVRLRADGSFSLRFALPDGTYELGVEAVSREGDEQRGATLQFQRITNYRGHVEPAPPSPMPQPPRRRAD